MARDRRGPERDGRSRGRRTSYAILSAAGGVLLASLVVAPGLGAVVLLYSTAPQVATLASPFRFVDGANYASSSSEGFVTASFPTSQQVGFSATVHGVAGAEGTYVLDAIELQARTNSTLGWHLGFSVVQPMAATGLNAAYLFYCTAAPSGVTPTGTPLASGTDSAGDFWSISAPTCAGTAASLSLTSTGSGTAIPFSALTFGTSELYLSFAGDLASGGLGTVTPAEVVLTASSP